MNGKKDEEIDAVVRQTKDKTVVSEVGIDVFGVAKIKKPDISIL